VASKVRPVVSQHETAVRRSDLSVANSAGRDQAAAPTSRKFKDKPK